MPEGDTIFRAAQTLNKALAGAELRRFETVFPHLERVVVDAHLIGKKIERVDAAGKHLLVHFAGGLVLRTHMRMNGSWHIYQRGEKWRRARSSMRIVIATDRYEAVGFQIPESEFVRGDAEALTRLGPDLLAEDFDIEETLRRLDSRPDAEIADALLDQTVAAGIGNVFKSEILWECRVSPFARVGDLDATGRRQLFEVARKQLRFNVLPGSATGRITTGHLNPAHGLAVYGRRGEPCIRCKTPISYKKQGRNVRGTYWCPLCQPAL